MGVCRRTAFKSPASCRKIVKVEPSFKPVADHAVLVTFADTISAEAHETVLALDKALSVNPIKGVIETVPALVNILVSFDPIVTDHVQVQSGVKDLLKALVVQKQSGAARRVQVCYDPPFAPDLDAVAQATGLSSDAVINAHLSGEYDVLMYGFAPGYAYLSGVLASIQVPRKPTPVRDVAAGSVIIAGPQCLVTTLNMPTGWSIIGRSPTKVLAGDPDAPFFFDVGDRVTFQRIDRSTFDQAQKDAAHG